MKEEKKRHASKSLTWRIVATLVSIVLIYFVTKSLVLASLTGLAINLVKTALYYFHERVWERTDWGRQP